ncbi:UNVERIFIED_CONTAM: hypothetical protein Sindi_1997100 [Sesamum indicum]
MSSRYALRLKAAENKMKAKGKQVAPPADPAASSPIQAPSRAPVPASPADHHPIQVNSEETPPLPLHGYNSSDLELNLDDLSGDQGGEPKKHDRDSGEKKNRKRASHKHGHGDEVRDKEPTEPSGSSKPSKSHRSKSLSRMAKEAAVKAEQADERKRFLRLEQLASCWEETREALRGDQPHPFEQKGDRMAPRWNNSSSSVLFSKAGGESFELYDSFTSLCNQSSLVANNPVRVEEYGVNAQLQALTFFRSLSMKCTIYRKNHILSDRKGYNGSSSCGGDADFARETPGFGRASLQLLTRTRRSPYEKGHKKGFDEGQAGRISLEEHHQILASSRVAVVRDILKTDTFKTAVEIKSADSFTKGYKTCEAQIEKLGGFQDFEGGARSRRLM